MLPERRPHDGSVFAIMAGFLRRLSLRHAVAGGVLGVSGLSFRAHALRIEEDTKLDFKDVLLRPKRSELSSRAQVCAHLLKTCAREPAPCAHAVRHTRIRRCLRAHAASPLWTHALIEDPPARAAEPAALDQTPAAPPARVSLLAPPTRTRPPTARPHATKSHSTTPQPLNRVPTGPHPTRRCTHHN